MANRDLAKSFLEMASSGDVQTAYDRHVDAAFIHHNQYFKGDRQSLLNAMVEASKQSPNKSLEIKQLFEQGDHVIAHSHVLRKTPGDAGIAVVHIFRFKNDKIVELWDLGQVISKDSPNENGLF